jgi:hypothetical protein
MLTGGKSCTVSSENAKSRVHPFQMNNAVITVKAPEPTQKEISFYFAGKISKNCWRHEIFGDLRGAERFQETSSGKLPISRNALGTGLHYSGPYFIGCDHGCYHGAHSNGVVGRGDCLDLAFVPSRVQVPQIAYDQIRRADVLFAWIVDRTCYGTLVEIGFAHALQKTIWLAYTPKMVISGEPGYAPKNDLWFAQSLAQHCCVATSAAKAFCYFLEQGNAD